MKDYGLRGTEQMEQVWGLYIGTGFYILEQQVVNLLNLFHYIIFSVSFVIHEKKTTVIKSLSIYFGHHSLAIIAFWMSWINIVF